MIETKGLGAGSYPEPNEIEEKTIKVVCLFESYINVPKKWDYEDIKRYVNDLSVRELTSEIDNINIEDIEE